MLGKSEDDFDDRGEVGGVSCDTMLFLGVSYGNCGLASLTVDVGEVGGELNVRSRAGL